MFKYFIICCFLLSISSYAQVVTPADPTDETPFVDATKTDFLTTNIMITERTSNQQPSSSSYPIKVYIPLMGGGSGVEDNVRFDNPMNSKIPDFDNLATSYIRVALEMKTSTSDNYYLYAAVYDKNRSEGDEWEVFEGSSPKTVTDTATNYHSYVLPLDILESKAGVTFVASEKYTIKVFFFLSNSTLSSTTNPNPSDYKGAYYTLNLSSTLPENTLNLIELKRGDQRLKAVFDGGESITEMEDDIDYKILAVKWSGPGPHIGKSFQDAGVVEVLEEVDPTDEGYVEIKGLQNIAYLGDSSAEVTVSLFEMNKYQMLTESSADDTKSPEAMDVLLKKQACFIVTAGFGEEHYVIDYFRKFRDEVMLQSVLGKAFVNIYYTYSPEIALKLYKYDSLRFLIRSISYGIYYLMNYFYGVILVLFGTLFFLYKRERNKLVA